MRASFSSESGPRRLGSWPQFLAHMKSASLTLVGFDGEGLSRMSDALEICARSKDIQAVEVFIRTLEDVGLNPTSVAPGLCLVRVPDPGLDGGHQRARQVLAGLGRRGAVAVVPVLQPQSAGPEVLKAVGRDCPVYLNIHAPLRDFASMFGAYLFPAALSHVAPGYCRPRTGKGSRSPALWQPKAIPLGDQPGSMNADRGEALAHEV